MRMFMKLAKIASVVFLACLNALAVTNQFRGVNWADQRDNFVDGVLLLSGISKNDTYESASVVADRVVGQFVELLGSNSVRIPVNEPTIYDFWDTYKGVIDGSMKHGRVIMGYWGPAQPSGPKNMDRWWGMWEKIVKDYGENPKAYFELFNEPHMFSKNDLRNLYATWLEKFPNVPHDHVILDGTGMAQNVPEIADDSRFDGCLFAVHEYTFWNMGITTEDGWRNSLKGKVGKYADRTICTEWGGAMSPGDKAGVHYETMDYNQNPTNYFMAYIRGIPEQLREWEMGSFYWPGLRDGDWYSMTKKSGEGANIKLEIVNQSGVDRMHRGWTDTVVTAPVVVEDTAKADTLKPADTTKVDSSKMDSAKVTTQGDSLKVDSLQAGLDTTSINAIHGLNRNVPNETMYKVFSPLGRYVGMIDSKTCDFVESLKKMGLKSGIFVVQGVYSKKTVRVRVTQE